MDRPKLLDPVTLLWTAFLILAGFGCARTPLVPGELTPKEREPAYLLRQACEPGVKIQGVKGSVWLKAKSREASGQFPAWVKVSAQGVLRLEVTNLLGGTEAVISVEGDRYSIQTPDGKKGRRREEGYGSWGGIPLRWATRLFLGQIPCPSPVSVPDARLSLTDQGELLVLTPSTLGNDPESYLYRFRRWERRLWPERLHWERKGTVGLAVDFKFDDPEDVTHSPKKWEATSSQGEVKVRWKDRDVN